MLAYNLMSLFRQSIMRTLVQPTMATLRHQVFAAPAWCADKSGPRADQYTVAMPRHRRVWFSWLWRAALDLPTTAQSGVPRFQVTTWIGALALAKTPKPIVDRLNKKIVKSMRSPELTERMLQVGSNTVAVSDQFEKFVAGDIRKWTVVAKKVGLWGARVDGFDRNCSRLPLVNWRMM